MRNWNTSREDIHWVAIYLACSLAPKDRKENLHDRCARIPLPELVNLMPQFGIH
jgi:hypothetical protein